MKAHRTTTKSLSGLTSLRNRQDARVLEEQLGRELLAVVAAALRPYRFNVARLLRLQAEAPASHGRSPIARKLFQEINSLAALATEWSQSSSYIDASGRPRVLSIRGKAGSFAALAKQYFGKRSVTSVLEFAVETGIAARVGADQVAQVNACVMLTGNRLFLLSRAILSVGWLLGAARANSHAKAKASERWPERQAYAVVPKESFGAFADQMRPQLYNLADVADRWLTRHAVRDQSRLSSRDSGLVGLHTYVFHD